MKVIGKVPEFFVLIVICIQKTTMKTKIKLTCSVFLTKKNRSGTANAEFGKFFYKSKALSPMEFGGDRENKNLNKERV